LWDMGLYTNSEIGELFGLTYSAISRRVSIMQANIGVVRKLKKKYDNSHFISIYPPQKITI
jgi:hypothetical protein